ncbi:sugar-phosphate nucleotidyltransferase, partial [Listeria monocytogenes]
MYELRKTDKDHVATPRYVVEDIYSLIDIES